MTKHKYYQAVGRRKEATAQIRLYAMKKGESVTIDGKAIKNGQIVVNDRKAEEYFPGEVNKLAYQLPFTATDTLSVFAVSARARGGGKHGQLDAVIHGIARALDKVDREKYHTILKKHGLLTRDPRKKERRKAGLAQKARAKKQSPKR